MVRRFLLMVLIRVASLHTCLVVAKCFHDAQYSKEVTDVD